MRKNHYLRQLFCGAVFLTISFATALCYSDSPATVNDFFNRSEKISGSSIVFLPPVRINDVTTGYRDRPVIAIDSNGTLYTAWADERSGDADIYFSCSKDGGYTWSRNVRVNDVTTSYQENPEMVVDKNGTLYIVWEDARDVATGEKYLYFSTSTDGGRTWSTSVPIVNASAAPYHPRIAKDENSGNIYVVWEDIRNGWTNSDIYFARSTDGGLTWEPDIKVNDDNLPGNHQTYPTIAVNKSGTIFIAWNDERGGASVYLSYSTDYGVSFSPNILISQYLAGNILCVHPLTDVLYAYRHYIAESTDGGHTFQNSTLIPDGGLRTSMGTFTIDNIGAIHAVWTAADDRNTFLLYDTSKNGTKGFGRDIVVRTTSVTGPGYLRPEVDIAAKDGYAYIVWSESIVGTDYDIYFSRSLFQPAVNTSLSLSAGWNLISIPVINYSAVQTIFESIDGKYDTILWYDASDMNDHWKIFCPTKPAYTNDLAEIDTTMGFWIHAIENCTLTVNGYQPLRSVIKLEKGWNLIGYPSNRTKTVAEVKTEVPQIIRIQGFDATTQYMLRDLADNENLSMWHGYWVYCSSETIWYIDWE